MSYVSFPSVDLINLCVEKRATLYLNKQTQNLLKYNESWVWGLALISNHRIIVGFSKDRFSDNWEGDLVIKSLNKT